MPIPLIRASDIPAGRVEWLWEQRIPIGGLTILEGHPGAMKSTLVADLAGRITTGRAMPLAGDSPAQPAGNVIIINGEDPPQQFKAQLVAAGNDLSRVTTLDATQHGYDWSQLLPRGLPELEERATALQPKLIVIDPFSAFIEGGLNNEKSVRRALKPLATMAQNLRAGVVLIRHLSKVGGRSPLHAGTGSVAVTGLARSVLLLARDPLDQQRSVLAHSKGNMTRDVPSLVFMGVRGTGGGTRAHWLGSYEITAKQLLAVEEPEQGSAMHQAAEFLRNHLSNGAQRAIATYAEAARVPIPKRTLDRAKSFLGVITTRVGFGPGSYYEWRLPQITGTELASIEANQNIVKFTQALSAPKKRMIIRNFRSRG
jgi:hypothetical protein